MFRQLTSIYLYKKPQIVIKSSIEFKIYIKMERHDLLHELPEYQDRIHQLKIDNAHFRKVFDEYHELEHEIHRINTGVEVVTEEHLHHQKANLLFMKDELVSIIKN